MTDCVASGLSSVVFPPDCGSTGGFRAVSGESPSGFPATVSVSTGSCCRFSSAGGEVISFSCPFLFSFIDRFFIIVVLYMGAAGLISQS